MLSTLSFRAQSLSHNTTVLVILPDTVPAADAPVLYLLHGMHGTHEDWLRKTCIERYAAERNMAVIMADGENSFYHDMKYGKKYFTFLTEEVPAVVRRVYGLSADRNKNYIAGLSMGGYGAVRAALMRPEKYAAAASLSGCLDMARSLRDNGWTDDAVAIWGENYRNEVCGTDTDIYRLLDNFPDDSPRPAIYAACGEQDFLFRDNIAFREYMEGRGREKGFEFKWEQRPGVHDWVFWDSLIRPAMDFCLGCASDE